LNDQAPGLRAQLGSTIEAAKRLVRAHIALARAEAGEIIDAAKRLVGFGLVALGLVLVVAQLLLIGGLLFLGEWLFGSIGWGVLLGALLLLDVALVAVLAAIDVPATRLGLSFGIGVIVGVVVGVVLALDLTHRGWSSLGDSVLPSLDPAWRATAIAVIVLAIVGAILGLIGGFRRGGGTAIGSAIGLAILGAIVGAITAISIPVQVGAALGVLVALIVWPALTGIGVARRGIDGEALKAKFTPDETIDETKETIEWVRARLPLAPKS
jgi:ABC-type transport system involved in multi-copper enzyme maturation permease subunit